MIKNYTEVIVDEAISDLIKTSGDNFFVCKCDNCIDKIKALVLNELKPFYVTCKTDEVLGKYRSREAQIKVDVISQIIRAKEIVGKHKEII